MGTVGVVGLRWAGALVSVLLAIGCSAEEVESPTSSVVEEQRATQPTGERPRPTRTFAATPSPLGASPRDAVGTGLLAVDALHGIEPGVWTGRYTNTFESTCRFENEGSLTVTVTDDGVSPSSSAQIDGVQIRSVTSYGGETTCALLTTISAAGAGEPVKVEGKTARGVWRFVDPTYGALEWPWTAQMNNEEIVGSWTCTGCSGGFTLKRSSLGAAAPAAK